MATPGAERSAIFALADQYVNERATLDPGFATLIGVHDFDHLLPDYSTEQCLRITAHTRDSLDRINALAPVDELDRVAKAVMVERLTVLLELQRTSEYWRAWGVIRSPLSDVRQVFELMDATSEEHADVVRQRMAQVRPALQSWRNGLHDLTVKGLIPPRRHVAGVAEQARVHAEGTYASLAERVARSAPVDLHNSGLFAAATDADAACGELADWLTETLVPVATDDDRCGLERYQLWFQYWNGTDLDAQDLYAWGWQDLRRIRERMWTIAAELAPGATSMAEVAEVLDADERRAVYGSDQMLERLQAFTDAAVQQLDGVHFDIDERIRRCDARLAPEGSAAAPYYIGPSEDLSRPGTTWLPTLGADRFSWWRFPSIWYHESVPGHHLQDGTTQLQADRLSRFHRLDGWTSGYGEGWALYAERLMDELGAFSDPGDELGFLQGQALRAARIVVDIGLHLGLATPDDLGALDDLGDCSGRVWTADMAVQLIEEYAIETHDYAVSEVDRYLSLPAQATSYKVGERTWLDVRRAATDRLGDRFDLKRFHAHALGLGPMGLDPFRALMAAWGGR